MKDFKKDWTTKRSLGNVSTAKSRKEKMMKRRILVFLLITLPFISFAEDLVPFRIIGVTEGTIQYLDTLESGEEFDSKLSELENDLKDVCIQNSWKMSRLKKTTKDIDRVCINAIEKFKTEKNEVYCVTFSLYDVFGDIDESIQYLAYVFIVKPAEPYSIDETAKVVFKINLGESDED